MYVFKILACCNAIYLAHKSISDPQCRAMGASVADAVESSTWLDLSIF